MAKSRKFTLNESEKEVNGRFLASLSAIIEAGLTEEEKKGIGQTLSIIQKYATNHAITLNNLTHPEVRQLQALIKEALQKKRGVIAEQQLDAFKATLVHAVAGQGKHVNMYREQPLGVMADLASKGYVPLGSEAAEEDIRRFFRRRIVDPTSIKSAGNYVLAPINLTESINLEKATIPFQTHIEETLKAIQAAKIAEEVTVRIPGSLGYAHFVFTELKIKNGKLSSVEYWDPLSGSASDLKQSLGFKNVAEVIAVFSDVKIKATKAAVQADSLSCGRYVMQEISRRLGEDTPVTKAKDPATLEVECARQIVCNSLEDDSVGNDIVLKNDRILFGSGKQMVDFVDPAQIQSFEEKLERIITKGHVVTEEEENFQKDFDAMVAKHLTQLYADNKHVDKKDEERLVAQARKIAMQEMGLFSAAKTSDKRTAPAPSAKRHKSK